jgi:hypothetical protein
MTPAALLVCMTIVTNVSHGTVATNACHYEQPQVAAVSENPVAAVAINTVNTQVTEVKALAVVDVAAEAKPIIKKQAVRVVRAHHRVVGTAAKPAMTATQDKAFRLSWFKRLADM